MEILKVTGKGAIMDIHEKFNIYKHIRIGECLNEQHIRNSNRLFDLLLKQLRQGRLALPVKQPTKQ
jgi:hypothetical protein